ncbi:hypothetical protein EPI10_005754 [Gossypium australe]|uniref:Uncharacterized protein n=1 Tax=Gossypium australe TaxID=47621 RepID=A0A5B6WRQ5_9ROSI|nr:hypothetical protein EPI10_005754 [Gossypium australe]
MDNDHNPISTIHLIKETDRTTIKCSINPTKPNQQAPKPPQPESSNSLENFLKAYMVKNDVLIQSQEETLKNLENQMGQLATKLHCRP